MRSPGLDHRPLDECASWADLGSVPTLVLFLSALRCPGPSPICLECQWAQLFSALFCTYRQTYRPLQFFVCVWFFPQRCGHYSALKESDTSDGTKAPLSAVKRGEEVWALKTASVREEEERTAKCVFRRRCSSTSGAKCWLNRPEIQWE